MLPASFDRTAIPRLMPERALPPRTYVPGRTTKLAPVEYACESSEAAEWRDSVAYRWGCELFNHGYYWEAHEVWEGLWHALGRTGTAADFIKGLIKLAAAGVKQREQRPNGVQRHCQRAAELFRSVSQAPGNGSERYGGLSLQDLLRTAEQPRWSSPLPAASDVVRPLLELVLVPDVKSGTP